MTLRERTDTRYGLLFLLVVVLLVAAGLLMLGLLSGGR